MARKKRKKREAYPNMKHPKIEIFDLISMDDDINNEFNDFFYKYDLLALFTNEHRAGSIRVTDLDARSVINEGYSYNVTLKKFKDYLLMAQDNKSYEEAIFKIIYNARSFQGLINQIKRLMEYIDSIDEDKKFNFIRKGDHHG
jgi:hypothetical protein